MAKKARKIIVKTVGKPPLSGAEALARLLLAVNEKKKGK